MQQVIDGRRRDLNPSLPLSERASWLLDHTGWRQRQSWIFYNRADLLWRIFKYTLITRQYQGGYISAIKAYLLSDKVKVCLSTWHARKHFLICGQCYFVKQYNLKYICLDIKPHFKNTTIVKSTPRAAMLKNVSRFISQIDVCCAYKK